MRKKLSPFFGALSLVLVIAAQPCAGQMVVKLSPETVTEFERYAKSVEAEINPRWAGKEHFISTEDSPAELQKVMGGEFLVRPAGPEGKPQNVTDGLIHDWVGTVFIPDTDPKRVIAVLRNFDNHKKIYPEITDSKTLKSNGTETVGYWRVQQRKGLVPVVLDVVQDAHYEQTRTGEMELPGLRAQDHRNRQNTLQPGTRLPRGRGTRIHVENVCLLEYRENKRRRAG